jgi:hypothetical protein
MAGAELNLFVTYIIAIDCLANIHKSCILQSGNVALKVHFVI